MFAVVRKYHHILTCDIIEMNFPEIYFCSSSASYVLLRRAAKSSILYKTDKTANIR